MKTSKFCLTYLYWNVWICTYFFTFTCIYICIVYKCIVIYIFIYIYFNMHLRKLVSNFILLQIFILSNWDLVLAS